MDTGISVSGLEENQGAIRVLREQLRTALGVVPFVGAGLSIPLGFPGWTDFLFAQAARANVEQKVARLIAKGRYEEAAECLSGALGHRAFTDTIEDAFGEHQLRATTGAMAVVPLIAGGPVVTTNFDHGLEAVFEHAGRRFELVAWGAKAGLVSKALRENRPILLKLHGDVEDRTDRVLTLSEYRHHYGGGDGSRIDVQRPLPGALRLILLGRPVLFLGCSLRQDRTVDLLSVTSRENPDVANYAVVERPSSKEDFARRARFLSDHGVRPIWYPAGRHDLIEPFLTELAAGVPERYRAVPSSTRATTPVTARTTAGMRLEDRARDLIRVVASGSGRLSTCLQDALFLAQDSGDAALAQFCRTELLGWSPDRPLEAQPPVPEYRKVTGYVSTPADMDALAATVGGDIDRMLLQMRTRPKQYPPFTIQVMQSVREIEERMNQGPRAAGARGFTVVYKKYRDLAVDPPNPDDVVTLFVPSDMDALILKRVQRHLQGPLVDAASGSRSLRTTQAGPGRPTAALPLLVAHEPIVVAASQINPWLVRMRVQNAGGEMASRCTVQGSNLRNKSGHPIHEAFDLLTLTWGSEATPPREIDLREGEWRNAHVVIHATNLGPDEPLALRVCALEGMVVLTQGDSPYLLDVDVRTQSKCAEPLPRLTLRITVGASLQECSVVVVSRASS